MAYTGYDWTDDTYIDAKLSVMGIDGSNPRVLTAGLDRTPQEMRWAPDGSGVYFTAEDRGTRNLHFVSLRGEIRQVMQGNQLLHVTGISSTGQAVGTLTSYYKPADVVAFDLRKPEPKQLTFVNDGMLQDVKLGEVEEIWYSSADSLRIQGWIIKPPGFDPKRKYPLMLTAPPATAAPSATPSSMPIPARTTTI